MMDRNTYVDKAQDILREYEPIHTNPTPKVEDLSDLSDPAKFRPISIVPGIAKIVERVVH